MQQLLFFLDSLGPGGAQRQMTTLAKLFALRGYKVSLLVYHDEDFFESDLIKNNILLIKVLNKSYFRRIIKIRKIIRQSSPNVVISFLDTPNFLACIAAIGRKKWKLIISERSNNPQQFKGIKQKTYRYFYKFADIIVFNSNSAKHRWHESCPQYTNKMATIYNTVLLDKITTKYIPRQNNKLNIVIVASYQYIKNPIGVVNALSLMNKEERNKIKIDWYGSNQVSSYGKKAYDEAKALIEKNHLQSFITFNDSNKNIANVMNEADMIGLFSQYEGLPNTICEGMMMSKPIIMTRVSDYSVLVSEDNGFLCDWDNSETIKNALVVASNLSVEKLKIMGNISKHKAENLFSSKIVIDKWMSIIKR
jgi:hypothetical protein